MTARIVQIKDIKIINRGRKDYGDLMELSKSIRKYGLINPVLVQPLTNDPTHKYELIAGERRTKASILAGMSEILATTREECSEIMKKELELEENIQRKELLWSEQCQMLLMLDELKREEHGSTINDGGNRFKESTWTTKDTALLVNKSPGTVSQDIQLAKAMRDDPKLALELHKLPKNAAFKKMQHLQEKKRLERLYKDVTFDADGAIRNGSCLDLIKELKSSSVDVIITDPPYAVATIEEAKGTYNKIREDDDNSNIAVMEALYVELIPEFLRVLKPGGHVYMFFANEWYPFLTQVFRKNLFNVDPVPIIWNKKRSTTPFRGYNYQQCYEPILLCQKHPREERRLDKPSTNILDFDIIDQKHKRHVFHKPPALINFLITQSSQVGQVILDPFCGSGQVVKSAFELKRQGIGFELSPDHYRKALEYLKEA